MKINLATHLKLALGGCLLLLSITLVIGGPPLQGEIPIGFYSAEDELVEISSSRLQVSPNKQEETYRLPLSVRPIHYDLEIRPILDSGAEDQFTAPGKVTIRVKCFESTNSITLHSKNISIKDTEITVVGVDPVGDVVVTGHDVDEARSFFIIHLDRNLIVDGEYLVTIPFTSQIPKPEVSMAGLYASSYQTGDGSTKYLATTQFQKDDASRAFPCFDEPSQAFRATFNVKIGRKAEGYHSLANTERVGEPEPIPDLDGWVWDNHNTTVNMPVYLIAIIVSDFKSETAPEDLYGKPVRTWAAPPLMTETSGKLSAEFAARILAFFEEYFDYPYQLSKMDSVAVPDFAAGAMENWGLNTYRTNLMVWFEEENTIFEQWRSAAVIAHELAHQWFGNLVTCEWWNDTWLNEGFARYLQFIAANHSGHDFRSLDRYVIDTTQLAMANDVLNSTEPVHSNVTDRIVNQNSRIVYEKAAALIRMMQSFLTEETLIKGLRTYLKRHQYGGVVQDDLFQALTEQAVADGTFTNYTVKEVMDTWTLQSGFPIIRVSRIDNTRLYISQEKFRLTPTTANDESSWFVPISYVTASDPDFRDGNLGPKDWMDKNQLIQSLFVDSTDRWVIINPDAKGFYRVIYDDVMTRHVVDQLENIDHKVISLGSRSQLFDDYFKSADAKYINIKYALNLTRYLHKEDDFIVWTTVFNNLLPISTRLTDTPAFSNFKQYVLSLIIEPLRRIDPKQKPTDPADVAILRTQLLDWACSMSHAICGETANELFAQWQAGSPDDKIPIPADIQPMLYCGAVAASTDPANTGIQDFLLGEYVKNRGTRQQTLIVNALACDQVPENLQKLMERAIDEDEGNALRLHRQALLERIALNSAGRLQLIRFINSQHAEITRIHGSMAVPTIISRFIPYLSSQSEGPLLAEVTTFINQYLQQENLPQPVRASLEASLRTITDNSAWMAYYYRDISDWLTPPPPFH